MRLGILLLLTIAGTIAYRRITDFTMCELVGHDAHWPTTSLRVCGRRGCDMTWTPPEPLARRRPHAYYGTGADPLEDRWHPTATTTNQEFGW